MMVLHTQREYLKELKYQGPSTPPQKRCAVVGALISILTPFFRCFHLCVTPRSLMMITPYIN